MGLMKYISFRNLSLWIKIIFILWLFLIIILCIYWIVYGTPENKNVAWASLFCGVLTLIFYYSKKYTFNFFNKFKLSNCQKFIFVAFICALLLETIFWFFFKIFNSQGVLAHNVLWKNYLLTMPWYFSMIFIFYFVQKKYLFSFWEIFILGGIYQLGADGFIGSLFAGNLLIGFTNGIIGFPLFTMVYSLILIPSYSLINPSFHKYSENILIKFKKYSYSLLPLLGLIPYFILYLILI
jgi:hypothetical protein